MEHTNGGQGRRWFVRGLRDGVPISLGYFAVSLTLGIAARNAGLTAFQATIASLTNNASAGEFAGFTLIAAGAGYWEMALTELIVNARYLLMSCALSQKLAPDTSLARRLLLGFGVTDELFGISVSVPGRLDPRYTFGAMTAAIPGWASGTCIGVLLGNALPLRAVSAMSVALYGMFLAVIVPPARKNKVVAALVTISFAASYAAEKYLTALSAGTRIILLTVLIAGAAAVLFPVREEQDAE